MVKSEQMVTYSVAIIAVVAFGWLATQYTGSTSYGNPHNFDISCGGNTPDYYNGGCHT